MDLSTAGAAGCAIALSWLMLAAGAAKLRHRSEHARAVEAYALLPAGAGRRVAPLLGALECTAGAAVWLEGMQARAALLMLVLLALYTGAVAINLARGRRDIDCGCAGTAAQVPLGGAVLVRNAALILAALAVYARPAALALVLGAWRSSLAALAVATLLVLLYNGANFLLSRDALLQDD